MSIRRAHALLCVCGALFFQTSTAAGDEPSTAVAPAPPDVVRNVGHERKGFFLRLAMGAGYLAGSRDIEIEHFGGSTWWTSKEPATYNGLAQLGEISLGGTIARGVVFGGGIFGTNVFSTTVKAIGMQESIGLVSTSLVCPLVDGYVDPRMGFHVGGGPCLAVAQIGDGKDATVGWGATGAVGYDFWVGGAWSVGVLGRVQYVTATEKDAQPFHALVPGLLLAATYY